MPFSLRFRVSRPFALLVCVSRPFLACSFNDVKASARVLSRILSQPQTPRSHVRAYRGVSMMLGRAGSGGEYHHRAPRRKQLVRRVHRLKHTHDAPFILILIIIIIIICILFLRGRTHMHPFSADALSRSCYRNSSSGAMLFTSMFSASQSRYVACHARRRCDGPCEWLAFRVRIRM